MPIRISLVPDLIQGSSAIHGKGAFAGRQYNSGDEIWDFLRPNPPVISALEDACDNMLQVGEGLYLGMTGLVSDCFNHSCDPAAAVVIGRGRVVLKAIRPIKPMMEVTFDYSLTMKDDPWTLECLCRSAACRKTVREYRALPEEVRRRYEWMKIVPEYNLSPAATGTPVGA